MEDWNWETIFTDNIVLYLTSATYLASKEMEIGEKTQNKGYYAVQGHPRSSRLSRPRHVSLVAPTSAITASSSNRNRCGDKLHPCLTPTTTLNHSLSSPSSLTALTHIASPVFRALHSDAALAKVPLAKHCRTLA